jgi:hypothetical protein
MRGGSEGARPRSRELITNGGRTEVAARVLQVNRYALYRTPNRSSW